MALSAIAPSPLPALQRKSRLEAGWRLCDMTEQPPASQKTGRRLKAGGRQDCLPYLVPINKLVRVEQHLAEVHQRGALRRIVTRRHRRRQRELAARRLPLGHDRLLLVEECLHAVLFKAI